MRWLLLVGVVAGGCSAARGPVRPPTDHVCPPGTRLGFDAVRRWCTDPVTGRRQGPFAVVDERGRRRLLGAFADGRMDGVWTQLGPTGRPVGTFRMARGTGTLTLFHPNGRARLARPYVDGQPHGLERRFDVDGQPLGELTWAAGRRQGQARTFHPGGAVASEGQWLGDRRAGTWRWVAPDGSPLGSADLPGGTGLETIRHPNGRPALVLRWQAGRRHGREVWSDPAGRPLHDVHWDAGRRHGLSRWWRDGVVSRTECWREDQRIWAVDGPSDAPPSSPGTPCWTWPRVPTPPG